MSNEDGKEERRIKYLDTVLTTCESRIAGFNHYNWHLHKDPRCQPCCVCELISVARRFEGVAQRLLREEQKRVYMSKSAVGSCPEGQDDVQDPSSIDEEQVDFEESLRGDS